MASVNKVTILGNLGDDPELRETNSGSSVCQLSVATNERWKDKDGNSQERTEWHRVIVWGKQGESCAKYLEKGRSVYVEGRIQTRSWEDDDGNKRYVTEIVASDVQFLSGGSGGGESDREERPKKKAKRSGGRSGGGRPKGRGGRARGGGRSKFPTQDPEYNDIDGDDEFDGADE